MPSFTYYGYPTDSTDDCSSSLYYTTSISDSQIQQQYEEWQREEEQRIKERERYPLFFWRETCKEKK